MNTQKLLLYALLLLFCSTIQAQSTLSEEDKKMIQDRVKGHVESFQFYLRDIANKELSQEQRRASITSALALFMGKGDRYYITDDNGNRVSHLPVRMQISNVYRSTKTWKPMKEYLDIQYRNAERYGKVVITDADIVRVDNIHKVGEGRYEAVAYFCQKYISYQDGRINYGDITGKKVKVYINAIETPVGTVWDAKLGDVYVTSTKKL